jgi:hypothetical protein
MSPEIITTRVKYPDSLEIGTPSKGGCLHIFFDADDLSGSQQRIDNAVQVRQHLLEKLSGGAV